MAMKQRTFASQSSFEKYGQKSRRELFLDEMELVVPWSELQSLVEPHYPKAGNGRRPVGLSIMLRTYFMQQWFNLSDPGVEEAFYESATLRRFAGVDLGVAPAPDETTVLRFRHLLEKHGLCGQMLEVVNLHLEAKGIRIASGTIVDATIIHAPSSTKNEAGKRDPAMHQTKKGKQWYFGLKAHIGVDSKQGTVHSVATAAANVSDVHMLPDLLHGEERKVCHPTDEDLSAGTPVWGDGGYQGQTKAIQQAAPKAQDMTCKRTKFKNYVDEVAKKNNTTKSRVRAKVEHVFRILKRVFGFDKVRYRGIAKNHHRLCANFALINLYLHRKRLARLATECASRPQNSLPQHPKSSQTPPTRRSFRDPTHANQINRLCRGSLTR
jgi:IS5 family transposase